jgi:hypothetical protein
MAPLNVEYLSDGKWRLTGELAYTHYDYGTIVVPTGTVTDFDSIPRLPFAHWLLKNSTVTGAVVHDYLYSTGCINDDPITRAQADKVFLDAMKDEGVGWWRRRMIWTGVRTGGWIAWNKHRDRDEPTFI